MARAGNARAAAGIATVLTSMVAVANGCGSPRGSSPAADAEPHAEGGGDLQVAAQAGGIAQARAHIGRIVVLVKENHTFDHYFADFDENVEKSRTVPLSKGGSCTTQPLAGAYTQHSVDANTVRNGGAMNGWDLFADWTSCDDPGNPYGPNLTYYPGLVAADRAWPYHQVAKRFTLFDHFFTSILGPSTPNHLVIASARPSLTDNCKNCALGCAVDPPGQGSGYLPGDCTLRMLSSCDETNATVANLLDDRGVAWRAYGGLDKASGKLFSPFHNFRNTEALLDADHLRQDTVLVQDLARPMPPLGLGDLATVTFVEYEQAKCDASGNVVTHGVACSEEGVDVCYGENWTREVVLGVAHAKDTDGRSVWYDATSGKGVVIVLTWDDWGSAFDHVTPEAADCPDFSRGMRVPLMVLSPFARRGGMAFGGAVVAAPTSFGAIPKLVEDVFAGSARLGAGARDTGMDGDLLSALDFTAAAFPTWDDAWFPQAQCP